VGRQLFLTGQITLSSKSISQAAFLQAAEKAWVRTRFEYPEIVQMPSGRFNPDGSAIMQCEVPEDDSVVRAWVRRTFHTSVGPSSEGEAMTIAESALRKQDLTDPVGIHWRATNPQCEGGMLEPMCSTFSLRVDHALGDGMSVYLLLGKYLRLISEQLSGRGEEQIDWFEAKHRIPESWVEKLNEEQRTEGKDFEEAVKNNFNLVLESAVCPLRVSP